MESRWALTSTLTPVLEASEAKPGAFGYPSFGVTTVVRDGVVVLGLDGTASDVLHIMCTKSRLMLEC